MPMFITEQAKPCMCGDTPDALYIAGAEGKYATVSCGACGEWTVEFRSDYDRNRLETLDRALSAWNEAPRGSG